jgi:hypothetical protein
VIVPPITVSDAGGVDVGVGVDVLVGVALAVGVGVALAVVVTTIPGPHGPVPTAFLAAIAIVYSLSPNKLGIVKEVKEPDTNLIEDEPGVLTLIE